MKKTKITLNFGKLSDPQLEALALAVAAALNGNTNFPEPNPTLEQLNKGIQLFSDGLALSQSRDRVKVALKNQLRSQLELLLGQLSRYCSYTAQGDRVLLAGTGFILNAETRQPRVLGTTENFTVLPGRLPGEVLVYVNAVKNATTYLFLYGPSPVSNDAWCHATSSAPYLTITGLVPGTIYHFKVGVTGRKGQVVYTDVITKMIA